MIMKKKMFLPLDEDHSERECPRCHKLIYNKKEGCPDPGCTAQHTPTPWKVGAKREDGLVNITNRCGLGIASSMPDDASLIVRAVNSHEALIKAAKALLAHRETPVFSPEAGALRVAIEQAKEVK